MAFEGRVFARRWSRDDRRDDVALFGVIAADEGEIVEGMVRGMVVTDIGGGVVMTPTGVHREPDEWDGVRGCSVSHLLTTNIWPGPSADSPVDAGGVYFRRTRAPHPGGRTVWIMAAALRTDALTLTDATTLAVTGSMGSWPGQPAGEQGCLLLDEPERFPHPTAGTTPDQILGMPAWGFDREPWGIYSTMDLATIDLCMEHQRLEAKDRTQAEEDRLQAIERSESGWLVGVGNRDETYKRFRREFIRRGAATPWDAVRTAAEQAAADRIAGEVIRDLDLAA